MKNKEFLIFLITIFFFFRFLFPNHDVMSKEKKNLTKLG